MKTMDTDIDTCPAETVEYWRGRAEQLGARLKRMDAAYRELSDRESHRAETFRGALLNLYNGIWDGDGHLRKTIQWDRLGDAAKGVLWPRSAAGRQQ